MEVHVELIPITVILDHIFGPHIGFREQERARRIRIHKGSQALAIGVRLRQILAAGPFTLNQIRRRVHAETIHAQVNPVLHRLEDGALHLRIVEVQIGLVAKEAMPEVLPAYRVEAPVRRLRIEENDAHTPVLVIRVAPDIPIAILGMLRVIRVARRLEPGVLV